MSDLDRLRKEVLEERKRQKEEEEFENLSGELFRLRNRKLIAKKNAQRAKIKKIGKIAKSILKGAGKSLATSAKSLNQARGERETNYRLNRIHGYSNNKISKNKTKKKGKKKVRYQKEYQGYESPLSGNMSISYGDLSI